MLKASKVASPLPLFIYDFYWDLFTTLLTEKAEDLDFALYCHKKY